MIPPKQYYFYFTLKCMKMVIDVALSLSSTMSCSTCFAPKECLTSSKYTISSHVQQNYLSKSKNHSFIKKVLYNHFLCEKHIIRERRSDK